MNYDDLAKIVDWDAIKRFKARGLNPERPYQKGTAQNPDIYFQAKVAANRFYTVLPDIGEGYMQEIHKITGREYHPLTTTEHLTHCIIVLMGSAACCRRNRIT